MKITRQLTNRENKSLDQYFQEIGKIELLTPGEEIELAIKIKNGDLQAQDKLVRANLRFVVSVAKMFQNQGLSLGDLINEGNIGLVKAAQRFDETRGFKFISYAVWWIRQGIMSAIADQSRVVRLPLNRVGNLTKLSKAYRSLEQEYERKPTTDELAKILDITSDEVAYTLQISGRQVSVDAPVKNSDENNGNGLGLRIGLEALAYFVAVHIWHHHIEQDQIRWIGLRCFERSRAIVCHPHFVALLA